MVFIDFHCHLDWESFDIDRDIIVSSMKDKNIICYSNTTSRDNYEKTFEMMKMYSNVKVCPGLYPQDAEKISDIDFNNYLDFLRKNKDNFEVIGEVGLDKHNTDNENLFNIQVKRFKQIIDFAIKLDKPLCIHTRKAEKEVLDILEIYVKEKNFNKFNLHCFTGKKKLINKIKELNIYCSIPMVLLNTQSFQILVKELSIKKILVETDSPFLNPNKERNSPLNVPLIYEKIAEIKGMDKKEIENIIYSNYMKLLL